MFTNLKNLLHAKGITIKKYAEFLEVNEKTVQNKLNGITDFTYSEFKKTCYFIFPEYKADFIFKEDENPLQTA